MDKMTPRRVDISGLRGLAALGWVRRARSFLYGLCPASIGLGLACICDGVSMQCTIRFVHL